MSKLLALAVVGTLVLGACISGRGQDSTPTVEPSPTEPTAAPEPVIAANVIAAPPTSLPEIDLSQMYQFLGIDTIQPVYDPQFVPANRSTLGDLDMALGVEINGEAKAYPITPLVRREMVNDVVEGVPILVTW